MLEQTKQNRVLNRMGARELTPEEVQYVAGWNDRMPGHFASQEWPHRRRSLRP